MPTERERRYYRDGYSDGYRDGSGGEERRGVYAPQYGSPTPLRSKPKRKLSAWNKFVKANSKKPRFRLRSGSPNLKKLGVAFRKTPAGKKSRK